MNPLPNLPTSLKSFFAPLVLALASLAFATLSRAQSEPVIHEVGKTKIALGAGNWVAIDRPVSKGTIGGSTPYPMYTTNHTKWFYLKPNDKEDSKPVLYLSITSRIPEVRLDWYGKCTVHATLYTHDFNTFKRDSNPNCLHITPLENVKTLREKFLSELKQSPESDFAHLRIPYYGLRGAFSNMGHMVYVEALLPGNLMGLKDTAPKAELPNRLPKPIAAWGDSLGANIEASMGLFSNGIIKVPAIELNPNMDFKSSGRPKATSPGASPNPKDASPQPGSPPPVEPKE